RLEYQQNKDLDAALKRLDEAGQIAPDLLDVPATRAELLYAGGRKDDSMRVLDEMVARKDDNEAHYKRGVTLCRINEVDRAEQDFVQLSKSQPEGRGYELLGKYYFDNRRLDQAIAALDAGTKVYPANESLQRELMKALMQRSKDNDVAAAEAICKQLDDAR